MKLKKLLSIFLLITIALFIFQACNEKSYRNTISCNDISLQLRESLSAPNKKFSQYSSDDLKFLFPSIELYDDICVAYSTDSTDVREIGVLHASNEDNAKKLCEEAKAYIKTLQEEKSEFLRNYSPAELTKLNSADVKQYGNYIIFIIAESTERDNAFKSAESLLTK